MADVVTDPTAARWDPVRGLLTAVLTNLLLAILLTVVGGVGEGEFVAVFAVSVLAGVRAARPVRG